MAKRLRKEDGPFLAPSILSADFSQLGREIKKVEKGGADVIHVDVMDGVFVPNISVGFPVIESVRASTKLPVDVHLMIINPERYVERAVKTGADVVTFNIEGCRHIHRTLEMIKKEGAMCGVAINPATPLSSVEEVFPFIDVLVIMTVNPGFGGQKFIYEMMEKIQNAYKKIKEKQRNILIEVDGGINRSTINKVIEAGADIIVAGSYIFSSSPEKMVKEARELIRKRGSR